MAQALRSILVATVAVGGLLTQHGCSPGETDDDVATGLDGSAPPAGPGGGGRGSGGSAGNGGMSGSGGATGGNGGTAPARQDAGAAGSTAGPDAAAGRQDA